MKENMITFIASLPRYPVPLDIFRSSFLTYVALLHRASIAATSIHSFSFLFLSGISGEPLEDITREMLWDAFFPPPSISVSSLDDRYLLLSLLPSICPAPLPPHI